VKTGSVGVVGAGTIGRGVAQDFAQHDHDVVLVDVSEDRLVAARRAIERDLRLHALYGGSRGAAAGGRALSRIAFVTDLAALGDAALVVENVTENWDTKREVHGRIDEVCDPGAVVAVNTSAIPITRVAALYRAPERVLGMHFMNPVPLMRFVEVIRGHHTSDGTLERALGVLAGLGKEGIVVADAPGFVTNRVLMLTINEAIFCVQDQIASPRDVDRIFVGCFGHKMGPLETADLIGLDTILNSITVLYEHYNDSKYRPSPLLRKMVDAGLLGRKTGEGFYTYDLAGENP
jgi:3-hydroxybutyryl-CoA dehydrogenase